MMTTFWWCEPKRRTPLVGDHLSSGLVDDLGDVAVLLFGIPLLIRMRSPHQAPYCGPPSHRRGEHRTHLGARPGQALAGIAPPVEEPHLIALRDRAQLILQSGEVPGSVDQRRHRVPVRPAPAVSPTTVDPRRLIASLLSGEKPPLLGRHAAKRSGSGLSDGEWCGRRHEREVATDHVRPSVGTSPRHPDPWPQLPEQRTPQVPGRRHSRQLAPRSSLFRLPSPTPASGTDTAAAPAVTIESMTATGEDGINAKAPKVSPPIDPLGRHHIQPRPTAPARPTRRRQAR